jgi:hypothetical protein
MTTRLAAQVACLLRAPWQWRRNDSGLWALRLSVTGMALLLVLPTVAALLWLPPRAAAVALAVLGGMALLLVWAMQFGALMRLDHPHASHAVPGHARALRHTALGLWLALVACASVGAAAAAAPFGAAPLPVAMAAALVAGAMLLFIACGYRWWWAWPLLPLLGALSSVEAWRRLLAQAWGGVQPLWQTQAAGVTLVLLLLQGLLLLSLFGQGGAQHAKAYGQRERMRKIMAAGAAGQKPTLAAYGRWGEVLGQPFQQLADAWLAHVCRRATARPGSAMARAEVVLHGAQHWVRQVSAVLLVQVVMLLALGAVLALAPVDVATLMDRGALGMSIGVTSMALSAVVSLPNMLWLSRREQALLLLLPGMPQGAALNRALAWRQLRQCLSIWLALLPFGMVLAMLGEGLMLLAFGLAVLPSLAWMWRDPSRMRAPGPMSALPAVLLCPLAGGLSVAALRQWPGLLWPWVMGVLLVTAGLLAWRWRRLPQQPQALPAGRLA